MHRIVIVGGGSAGLAAVRALRFAEVEVTLVDRRNYHLFKPLLPQAATGAIPESDLATPFRALLRKQPNANFLLGEAVYLEPDRGRLILADGTIPYDSLIVATGSSAHHDGNPAWAALAPSLRTLEDARAIRNQIFSRLEQAARTKDDLEKRDLMRFLILLGNSPSSGAEAKSGVEFAGALVEALRCALKYDFHSITPEIPQVLIADAGARLLHHMPTRVSRAIERDLVQTGIEFLYNRQVTDIRTRSDDRLAEVTLTVQKDSRAVVERLTAGSVFWSGKVEPASFLDAIVRTTRVPLTESGLALVSPQLTVPSHENVFLAGSLAAFKGTIGDPKRSMAQGNYVARAILAQLRGQEPPPYRDQPKNSFVLTRPDSAIGRLTHFSESMSSGFCVRGRLGWWAWMLRDIAPLAENIGKWRALASVAGLRIGRDAKSSAQLITRPEARAAVPRPLERETSA